jgi:hypothetical protein
MVVRRLLQCVLALLVACAGLPVFSQDVPQFAGNRALLLAGDFAALERLYPVEPDPAAHDFHEETPSVYFFRVMELGQFADNWPQEDKATRAWLEHSPDSLPAALARSMVLVWQSGRMDTAGQWTEAESALREMEQLLAAVKPKATKDMEWHTLHLTLGHHQGWTAERIKSAIEAGLDVDATSLYFHMTAAVALSPDWRGSAEPLEWLARQGAARTPSQRAATYAFSRMWTAESIEVVYSRPFGAGLVDWELMNQGLAELYRRTRLDFYLNAHAALACRADDKRVTAELLGRIGEAPVVADAWKLWGGVSHYENCKKWAEAGALKS